VFVRARIANLKELSKPISSKTKQLDKIKRLRKNEINIKNEILTFSSVILFSELKIVLLIMLFGLINLSTSADVIFKRM
tara:strand:+ start:1099 stop:1335 length:237 start_codon:yes stop_codon:yes gene_type:complete